MTALVLVPPSLGKRAEPCGLRCPACSVHYGFAFRPKVTIRPQSAIRLPSGSIVIDGAVVVCASCRDRGLETVL